MPGVTGSFTGQSTTYRQTYLVSGDGNVQYNINTGFTGTTAASLQVGFLSWSVANDGGVGFVRLWNNGATGGPIWTCAGSGMMDLRSRGSPIPNLAVNPNGIINVEPNVGTGSYSILMEINTPYNGIAH